MENKRGVKADYTITFIEACNLLNKSRRTVSRYIKKGILNPKKMKSKKGTLEYRFTRNDLLKFKKPDKTGQRTEKTSPEGDIVSFLKSQIQVKDEQIKELLERSRETNILLKGLQNQLLLTEGKKEVREDRGDREDKTRQGINGWLKRLFKGQ